MSSRRWWLLHGPSEEKLRSLPDASIDAMVTDPPSGTGFMGKDWDCFRRAHNPEDVGRDNVFGRASRTSPHSYGESDRENFITFLTNVFREAYRVLKPGAYSLVWALPRTSHWTATAIENAGFEIRDRHHDVVAADVALHAFLETLDDDQREMLMRIVEGQSSVILNSLFLNGFPKYQNARRELDMHLCQLPGRHYDKNLPKEGKRRPDDHLCPAHQDAEFREGFATALKPTVEHWIVARKPMAGTQAVNQLRYGTGALNINACRVPAPGELIAQHGKGAAAAEGHGVYGEWNPVEAGQQPGQELGRWPRHMTLTHGLGCKFVGVLGEATGQKVSAGGQNRSSSWVERGGTFRDGQVNVGVRDFGDRDVREVWECVLGCPVRLLDEQSGVLKSGADNVKRQSGSDDEGNNGFALGAESRPAGTRMIAYGDQGGASRMFNRFHDEVHYEPKPSGSEKDAGLEDSEDPRQQDTSREGDALGANNPRNRGGKKRKNFHPTVKSIPFMRWALRLVVPPNGIVLDPFAGSGSTGCAAVLEGVRVVLIEKDADYLGLIKSRMEHWTREADRIAASGASRSPDDSSGEEA